MQSRFDLIISKFENKGVKINNFISNDEIKELVNDLDIYEAELLAQNEELISKDNQNSKLIERLNIIFENAPTKFLLLSENLNIVKYNEDADEKFELSKQNVSKKYFPTLCVEQDRNAFLSWIINNKFINE